MRPFRSLHVMRGLIGVYLSICLTGCATSTALTVPSSAVSPPVSGEPSKVITELQDTGLHISCGEGNLAWSHNGEYLAYTSGYSIWVVPIGKWAEKVEVYTTGVDRTETNPYILLTDFLAWSPDDTRLGFTVTEPLDAWHGKKLMAQVAWPSGIFELIAEEEATLLDWSDDNRILAYRDEGYWIYDIEQRTWQPVDEDGGGNITAFAQWLSDGNILYAASADWRWESGGSIFIYKESWGFEVLKTVNDRPLHLFCSDTFPCFPVASRDGHWIAWTEFENSADVHTQRIMLYNRLNAEVIELVDSRDYNLWEVQKLSWSPDALWLIFSAKQATSDLCTIWMLDLY